MKVIICGDRNFNDYAELLIAIKQSRFKITEIVSGGANGADNLGEKYADINNIKKRVFAAQWDDISVENANIKTNSWGKLYNANAGFTRNQKMADYADACIAIQVNGNTPGTQDMIRRAKKNKLKLYIHRKFEYEF